MTPPTVWVVMWSDRCGDSGVDGVYDTADAAKSCGPEGAEWREVDGAWFADSDDDYQTRWCIEQHEILGGVVPYHRAPQGDTE